MIQVALPFFVLQVSTVDRYARAGISSEATIAAKPLNLKLHVPVS